MKTKRQLILDAANLIEKHGLARNTFGSPSRGFCMLGALNEERDGLDMSLVQEAVMAIGDRISAEKLIPARYEMSMIFHSLKVIKFNDEFAQSKEEVVSLLRRAAEDPL